MFLLFYRQTTEIRADGIYVKRKPFSRMNEVIRFSDFVRYQPRNSCPVYTSSAWGVPQGWEGKAYNMGAAQGLELLLVNGGRVLIGTSRMRQLLDALHAQCGRGNRQPMVILNA